MGDFAIDTAVEGRDGRYRANLSEDWRIWGPNGGYVAAIALRAAGAATPLTRPASFSCHFLNVAEFGEIDIDVQTLRGSKRAVAMRVGLSQGDRRIMEALVWVIADGSLGLEHEALVMPEVPAPEEMPEDGKGRPDEGPRFPFWQNIETREPGFVPWEERESGEPRWCGWLRYRPTATFADPFVDAGRQLLLIDTMLWPATCRHHVQHDFMAPSIDAHARFHQGAPDEEWLLCDAQSPMAAGGLLAGAANIWSRDGRLLASGGGTLLCRPVPKEMRR